MLDLAADVVEQPVGLLDERDAAEDHLGVDHRLAGLLGDRRDDDEDAVVGEHPAVAQRDVGGIADVDAVDEDHPGLLGLAEARAALVDLERQTVLALEHALRDRSRPPPRAARAGGSRLWSPWTGSTYARLRAG